MCCRRWLVILILLMLNACASDIKIFDYTIWGRPSNSVRPTSIRVKKGDTLYSISRKYDAPIREIIEENRFRPPYTLKVGQLVKLPKAKYHIVEKGDTLYNISKRYNVDMPTLSKTNNLVAPFTLTIGQKLLLPGSLVTSKTYASANAATKQKTNTKTGNKKQTYINDTYPKPTTKRKEKFAWPVKGQVVSNFGPISKGRNNDGINIKAPKGTPIKAADKGTVAYAGNELKGFGNLILIRHDDGWVTAYAHADAIKVKKGQKVTKDTVIATVGNTGGVSTPQLHFETRAGKKALNPKAYLR